jgi:AraC-like DNA-binding protein
VSEGSSCHWIFTIFQTGKKQSISQISSDHITWLWQYLKIANLTGAEISFLIGHDDPNSFSRAFHNWTGSTPEQVRNSAHTLT